ncbi:MAG: beta-hydroxyacyl-ACP dehydratase [Phycisphaerales bacterium]|nr:beta-hydroxyacyl-ACP dehydratase [Phycisphaerae bacterium]NNM27279.1 beta-hydroxyacyl-ACP dehydratase [Phycisphaerales bacterium]
MWIDKIVAYEAGHRLVAIKNVSLAEEHLHDHLPADDDGPATPVMPGSLIIEGMAQTAGVLVGATNGFTEKVILAKVARASLEEDVVPGDTIRYDAELVRLDDAGAVTAGTVTRLTPHAEGVTERVIGRVELMFSHLDRNRAGQVFPEENFVFSDNFRMILRAAGLEDLAPDADAGNPPPHA